MEKTKAPQYTEAIRMQDTLRLVEELRTRSSLKCRCSCEVQSEIANQAGWPVVAAAYKMCRRHHNTERGPGNEICENLDEFLDQVKWFVNALLEKMGKEGKT